MTHRLASIRISDHLLGALKTESRITRDSHRKTTALMDVADFSRSSDKTCPTRHNNSSISRTQLVIQQSVEDHILSPFIDEDYLCPNCASYAFSHVQKSHRSFVSLGPGVILVHCQKYSPKTKISCPIQNNALFQHVITFGKQKGSYSGGRKRQPRFGVQI